jgi:hypothetical protein
MRLPRRGRELYAVDIVTTPATLVTQWEASFDGGSTWVSPMTLGDGRTGWLLAGPAFSGIADPGQVVVVEDCQPYARLTDTPEVLIRDMPRIELVNP